MTGEQFVEQFLLRIYSEEGSCPVAAEGIDDLHASSDPRSTLQCGALCQPRAGLELADNIADTMCEAAPDDQHCQVVLVVDCDQIPEALGHKGLPDDISCALVWEKVQRAEVWRREESFLAVPW